MTGWFLTLQLWIRQTCDLVTCFERVWNNFERVIRPEMTLCGWRDSEIQKLVVFLENSSPELLPLAKINYGSYFLLFPRRGMPSWQKLRPPLPCPPFSVSFFSFLILFFFFFFFFLVFFSSTFLLFYFLTFSFLINVSPRERMCRALTKGPTKVVAPTYLKDLPKRFSLHLSLSQVQLTWLAASVSESSQKERKKSELSDNTGGRKSGVSRV